MDADYLKCGLCIYLLVLSTTVNQNTHEYVCNRFACFRQCKGLVRNCTRRCSQTVTLLLTAKMWIFLLYVTCVYRYNSTAKKRITGKELTNLYQSGHVLSSPSLYSVHKPKQQTKETNFTDYLSKYKVICITVWKTGLSDL